MELEQDINKIIKSRTPTNVASTLSEIEKTHEYINRVQIKKLLQLHDEQFQQNSYMALEKLYERHNEKALSYGDLQSWAEKTDRDIRLLEYALKTVKENMQNND